HARRTKDYMCDNYRRGAGHCSEHSEHQPQHTQKVDMPHHRILPDKYGARPYSSPTRTAKLLIRLQLLTALIAVHRASLPASWSLLRLSRKTSSRILGSIKFR